MESSAGVELSEQPAKAGWVCPSRSEVSQAAFKPSTDVVDLLCGELYDCVVEAFTTQEKQNLELQINFSLSSCDWETLTRLLEQEPQPKDINFDILLKAAKRIFRSAQLTTQARFVRTVLSHSDYKPVFAKLYLDCGHTAAETISLINAVMNEGTGQLSNAARTFALKLLTHLIERDPEHLTTLVGLLVAEVKRAVTTDLVYQKTLAKLLFTSVNTHITRNADEQALVGVVTQLVEAGMQLTTYTLNKLIDVLNKHPAARDFASLQLRLLEAAKVPPNIVTFNTMMDHLCTKGSTHNAFTLLTVMQAAGIEPDSFTASLLIKGIRNSGDDKLALAEQFRAELFTRFVHCDCIVYNSLLDLYVSLGQTSTANAIYEEMCRHEMPKPDCATFNTLIKGCCRDRDLPKAMSRVSDMRAAGVAPNVVTYNTLMSLAAKSDHADQALALLEQMQAECITPDGYTYSTLLNAFKLRNASPALVSSLLARTQRVIQSGEIVADEVLLNTVFDLCNRYELSGEAIAFYDVMRSRGIRPGHVAVPVLVKSFSRLDAFDRVSELFEEAFAARIHISEQTVNSFVEGCLRTGKVDIALQVIKRADGVVTPTNSIVYTTLLKGLTRAERFEDALRFFASVKEKRTIPGMLITYNCALDCLVRKKDLVAAIALFEEIDTEFKADAISFSTLVKGLCLQDRQSEAFARLQEMVGRGLEVESSLGNFYLDACANPIGWSEGINGFNYLMARGFTPNEVTFGVMVKTYGFAQNLDKAFALLDQMKAKDITPSIVVFTNLIHISFYCKNPKKAQLAFSLFAKTGAKRDSLIYSKMVDGLLWCGLGGQAVAYLDMALKDGCALKPATVEKLRVAARKNTQIASRVDAIAGMKGDRHVCPSLRVENTHNENASAPPGQLTQKAPSEIKATQGRQFGLSRNTPPSNFRQSNTISK